MNAIDYTNNLLNDVKTYHKTADKRRNPTSYTEKSLSSKKQLEKKLYYKLHSTSRENVHVQAKVDV